eukprot:1777665-Rhodomonas_salina.5
MGDWRSVGREHSAVLTGRMGVRCGSTCLGLRPGTKWAEKGAIRGGQGRKQEVLLNEVPSEVVRATSRPLHVTGVVERAQARGLHVVCWWHLEAAV